jgi:hypothetical protein
LPNVYRWVVVSPKKKPRRPPRRRAARAVSRRVADHAAAHVEQRLAYIIEQLGSNEVSRLLGVSQSQPSRWRGGREGMAPDSRRRILDLDYVMARLLEIYPAAIARIWLESHNAHLGARPIDVLRIRGAQPVVSAIDAEAEGAYA